jgi:hypothetical protein
MKFYKLSLLSLVAATLVACGGGGDSAPAANADKYVGSWAICVPTTSTTNGVLSGRATYVFAKTTETALSVSLDYTFYGTTNCAGSASTTSTGVATGTVNLNGTKTVGTDTVDRLNFALTSKVDAELNGPFKDIGLISGNTLKFGASSAADAEGYPTAIDSTGVFTKQ